MPNKLREAGAVRSTINEPRHQSRLRCDITVLNTCECCGVRWKLAGLIRLSSSLITQQSGTLPTASCELRMVPFGSRPQ
jgi:hypothetical protein